MLDSVWGTVPIDADTFSMIGGRLVVKKSRKIVFQVLFGILGLPFPHGIDVLVVFRLVAARFRLCSRFLGWLWLLLQFLVACCDFCVTFCDFLLFFLVFSCFLGFVVFCCLFAAVCFPFHCPVLSFYCPFDAFCCLAYSFF